MTHLLEKSSTSLVDLLSSADQPRRWVERKLAEIAQGVIASLRNSSLSIEEAETEIFNLNNYMALRRRRMSRELKELFEWGMELEDVVQLVPSSLPQSLDVMSELARRVIDETAKPGRGRRKVLQSSRRQS